MRDGFVPLRWDESIWPAVMDDVRWARVAGAALPAFFVAHLLTGRSPRVDDLAAAGPVTIAAWLLAAVLTVHLVYRVQLFFFPKGRRASRLMLTINIPLAFALIWGVSLNDALIYSAGIFYLSTCLFVGGSHPLDRWLNLGWGGFGAILFSILVENASRP